MRLKISTCRSRMQERFWCQIRAASVNPVDFKIRSGKYPAVKNDRLPYTLGRDVSGDRREMRCPSHTFQDRRRSVRHGRHPRRRLCGEGCVDQIAFTAKPAGLDHIQAAAIPLAGQTAWQGLFRHGGLKAGQSVLIHGGSGGVGHFAIQFAKARGARVLTTVSTNNVGFARDLGADVVIDYKTQRFEDHASDSTWYLISSRGNTRALMGLFEKGRSACFDPNRAVPGKGISVWRARIAIHGRGGWRRTD